MHVFDAERNFSTTGIVGSSVGVALGYAYAFAARGDDRVAMGVTGEGGVNTGAFHESMNMAGAWKLPLVVLIENNEYAISVPFRSASATETVAERAPAYAAWGRRVDGTNVETVADAFAEAVAHARSGAGPAILEATCYRFQGHYEGDFDLYRPRLEKEEALRSLDPLIVARRLLLERGEASDDALDAIVADEEQELRSLEQDVLADPLPDAAGAADYVFVGGSPA